MQGAHQSKDVRGNRGSPQLEEFLDNAYLESCTESQNFTQPI